jgi:hypothetical protein
MSGQKPYPHSPGCACCQEMREVFGVRVRVCNVCAHPVHRIFGERRMNNGKMTRDRCTNGRCIDCCIDVCTDGGSVDPGHAYGSQESAEAACKRNGIKEVTR